MTHPDTTTVRVKASLPLPLRDAARNAYYTVKRARGQWAPHHPKQAGLPALQEALGAALGWPAERVADEWVRYSRFEDEQGYMARFGERETLTPEEAFVAYCLVVERQPPVFAEIGTHHGKSTRKLLDIRGLADVDYEVHCFDIAKRGRYFDPDTEVAMHVEDVTGQVRERILDPLPAGVLFLDARPRELLRTVLDAVLDDRSGWVMIVHDCGAGLYNPGCSPEIPDEHLTSRTGIWERWYLADAFGVTDPLSPRLSGTVSRGHRLDILPSRHGLAVITPA